MESILSTATTESFSLGTYLLCIGIAFVCGIITAFAANFRAETSKSTAVSEILLPPIVATVLMMVSGSIGAGIAIAGAFSLVRFRSAPGKARDIVAIFLAMAAGVACAAGYVWIALLFTVIVSCALVVLSFIKIGSDYSYDVKITVPENLNFHGAFDDLFAEYTSKNTLVAVKTANMGTMYRLSYSVDFKDDGSIREFIDKVRCRNGNLEISVCRSEGGNSDSL